MNPSDAGKLGYEKTKHILDQHRLEKADSVLRSMKPIPNTVCTVVKRLCSSADARSFATVRAAQVTITEELRDT